jgi:hypothetical protein
MFLLDLRKRLQRRWFDRSEQPHESPQQAATNARERRASNVLHLQSEVHRLQLEIADLSRTQQRAAGSAEGSNAEARMLGLQEELVKTQQALAKLQGRV